MIGFEKYLIEQGFEVSHQENGEIKKGYKPVSSLGVLFNSYEKEGFKINVGLWEVGLPPTVTYPEVLNIRQMIVEETPDHLLKILYEKLFKTIIHP